MWDDVVQSNETAERVVAAQMAARGQPAYRCGHYAEWLEYGYLQQGREQDALDLLAACERDALQIVAWFRQHPQTQIGSYKTPAALEARLRTSLTFMRGMAAVDSPRYRKEFAKRTPAGGHLGREAGWVHFGHGLAQAATGDLVAARQSLLAVQGVIKQAPDADEAASTSGYLHVMERMLDGAIAHAEGRTDAALASVADAAARFDTIPFDFGPPATLKPPHELAGEILLAAGRAEEALREFDLALKWAPKRALSLAGRARAQSLVAGHQAR